MKLSDFDYNLPKELIASSHIEPRDHSRLLVLDRSLGYARDEQARSGEIEHKHFYDIIDYLKKGDILVFNNSKVFKARIFGTKKTGGRVEFLLVRPINDHRWEALVRGKVKVGDKIIFNHVSEDNPEVRPLGLPRGRTSGRKLEAEIVSKKERSCEVVLNASVTEVFKYLEKYGELPLPPYIKNSKSEILNSKQIPNSKLQITNKSQITNHKSKNKITRYQDNNLFYQTVYAKNVGSVAAPTAGFHFTKDLLEKIKQKGVEILEVTLHVGPGTFLPVETDDISEHKMHEEFFEVKKEVWDKIVAAKTVEANGCSPRRIIAVGTTTTRVLEALAEQRRLDADLCRQKFSEDQRCYQRGSAYVGSTDIFIYPPYEFKIVDALITNFHLPKSTLLMLVSAFADTGGGSLTGGEKIKKAYKEALEKKYRFYSFGDSMLIY